MKVVSKRAPGARVLDDVARLQRTLNRLRGRGLVPRGLYRFSSFEEADRWMMSQIARSAAHLNSKTSSPSAEAVCNDRRGYLSASSASSPDSPSRSAFSR